jgi:hypothetical protein
MNNTKGDTFIKNNFFFAQYLRDMAEVVQGISVLILSFPCGIPKHCS